MRESGDSPGVAGVVSGRIAHGGTVGLITRRSRVQITPPLLGSGNLRSGRKTRDRHGSADRLNAVAVGVGYDGHLGTRVPSDSENPARCCA